MEINLPPDLDRFVIEQAKHHGFETGDAYITDLIARHKERETHDWSWFHQAIRPGLEADDNQFKKESATDVIRRGKARLAKNV